MEHLSTINEIIAEYKEEIDKLCIDIWKKPEYGFEEYFACEQQLALLKKWGFSVQEKYCGLDTSFRAEYGSGSPVFAIASEYDCLPDIGHGCGHNLICGAAMAAFKAAAEYMEKNNIPGKLVLLGTPAEEYGGGKVIMADAGALDDVDAVMMVHPSSRTGADSGSLSMTCYDVTFSGKAAHAGGSPHLGINALDAVRLMYSGIDAWRQQLPEDTRVHGIVTAGGSAPNIIPDHTSCQFYLRANDIVWQMRLDERFRDIVKGAALMTGCTYEIKLHCPIYQPRRPSKVMNDEFDRLCVMQDLEVVSPGKPGRGSSDFGNFSQLKPGIHPYFNIFEGEKSAGHSTGMCKAAGTQFALDNTRKAAAVMASIAVRFIDDAEFRQKIVDAHKKQQQ